MKPVSASLLKTWWNQTTNTLGTLFVGILSITSLIAGILLTKIAFESIDFDRKCLATIGVLDNTYTEVTQNIFVDYRVKYHFEIDGRVYHQQFSF